MLYANNTRMQLLDAKFSKTVPDLSPGEEIRFTKFIVQIERRRLEGRSIVKRENQLSNSSASASKTVSPSKSFQMPGNIGKNMGALASGAKTVTNFPKKGRKAFICPQKPALDAVSEESLSPTTVKERKVSPPPVKLKKTESAKELKLGSYDFGAKPEKSVAEEEDIFLMLRKRREALQSEREESKESSQVAPKEVKKVKKLFNFIEDSSLIASDSYD